MGAFYNLRRRGAPDGRARLMHVLLLLLLSALCCITRAPPSPNSPRHRLGATILRDHLLKSQGFRVLSIHYADWPSSSKQHTRWLRAELASHHACMRSAAPSE